MIFPRMFFSAFSLRSIIVFCLNISDGVGCLYVLLLIC